MTPVDELRRRASRAGEARGARGAAPGVGPPTAVATAGGQTRRRARRDALLDGSGITLLRLVVDGVALTAAVVVTLHWPGEPVSLRRGWVLLALVPLTMLMFAARGLYRAELWSSLLDGVRPVIGAVSVATMFVVLAIIYLGSNSVEPGVVAHAWLLAVFLTFVATVAGRAIVALRARHPPSFPIALAVTAALGGLAVNSMTDYWLNVNYVMALVLLEIGALVACVRAAATDVVPATGVLQRP